MSVNFTIGSVIAVNNSGKRGYTAVIVETINTVDISNNKYQGELLTNETNHKVVPIQRN